MRIGSLFGVPILLHWTYLSPIALTGVMYGRKVAIDAGLGTVGVIVLAVLYPALLAASLLAHEFGHVRVAQHYGVEVKDVRLYMFGAVANLRAASLSSPWQNFAMAAMGPLVSLILAAVFIGSSALLTGQPFTNVDTTALVKLGPFAGTLTFIGYANATLGIFNLMPAYPMDGGRILHSVLWSVTRDFRRRERLSCVLSMTIGMALTAWCAWNVYPYHAIMSMFLTYTAYVVYNQKQSSA